MSRSIYSHLFILTLFVSTSGTVLSDDHVNVSLKPMDVSGTLLEMNPDQIRLQKGDGSQESISTDEVKTARFRQTPALIDQQGTFLQLTNRDLIRVDSIQSREEEFIASVLGQEIRVPFEFIQSLLFQFSLNDDEQPKVEGQRNDVVFLQSGDLVRGEFLGLDAETLTVLSELGELKLPRTQLAGLQLDPALSESVPLPENYYEVALTDGTMIKVDRVELREGATELSTTSLLGFSLILPREKVQRIEVWNTRSRPMKADLLLESSMEDYWGNQGTVGINRTTDGKTLLLGGERLFFGYGVQGKSELKFEVPPEAETLHLQVGFEDRIAEVGDVELRVTLDDSHIWSGDLRCKEQRTLELPPLEVRGGRLVRLQMDFGKRADVGDKLIWREPYFRTR